MNDVLAQLAEANPVRVGDLAELDHPNLARRPARRRRLVAAAVIATAVAASLVGVFVLGGSTPDRSTSPHPRSKGGVGPTGPPGPIGPFSVAHPIYSPQVSPAEAAAAIGVPVVLPDTGLIRPADAGPMLAWRSRDVRGLVAVTYPGKGLDIEYERPSPWSDPRSGGLVGYARHFSGSHMTRLGRISALVIPRKDDNIDHRGHKFGYVIFDINGLGVTVIGRYDEAALESVARSIVRRTPSVSVSSPGLNLVPVFPKRTPVSLGKVSRRLGVRVPLPGLRFLKRSTAAEGWAEGTCPPSGGKASCLIWIPFPAERLSIFYERPRPHWPRTRRQYRRYAERDRVTRYVELDGVPAWEIPTNVDGQSPGSIDFAVGGTRVVVSGHRKTAALEAIARSIVDRSR
jgi:hypothetical protein